jgi:hypothetical protein
MTCVWGGVRGQNSSFVTLCEAFNEAASRSIGVSRSKPVRSRTRKSLNPQRLVHVPSE